MASLQCSHFRILKTKTTQHQSHWEVWATVCAAILHPSEASEAVRVCNNLWPTSVCQERRRSYGNTADIAEEEQQVS